MRLAGTATRGFGRRRWWRTQRVANGRGVGCPPLLAMEVGVPDLLHASPVLGGAALLGEARTIAAVSSYRFASISPAASGAGLRGAPREAMSVSYSKGVGGGLVHSQDVTLGADGRGSAVLN